MALAIMHMRPGLKGGYNRSTFVEFPTSQYPIPEGEGTCYNVTNLKSNPYVFSGTIFWNKYVQIVECFVIQGSYHIESKNRKGPLTTVVLSMGWTTRPPMYG